MCVKVCVCVSGGCNPSLREPMKETAGAKRLRSAPPPSPPTPQPRYLLYPGCQVVAAQQNKVNAVRHERSPSPLMRDCCLVPTSVCKCLCAPAHPSFTMPVLKLLSDPGSVRTQVSCCARVRVLMCILSACVCCSPPL